MRFAYMPDTHFGVYGQTSPTPQEAADSFAQLLREAQLAEEMGFDAVFIPERHARGETFVPSTLTLAAAIAAKTSTIQIVTAVMMPTLYNPMHLAEQIAMIDNLSRGRFIFGAGVGYHEDYHRMFGVPWANRGRRFDEAMEVIVRALSGERFSFQGEFYSYTDVQLTPQPYQRPRPRIWIGANAEGKPTDRSLDYDGWILWAAPEWDRTAERVLDLRTRAAQRGNSNWSFVLNQDGWIGDDPAEMRARHSPRWLRESEFYVEHKTAGAVHASGDIRQADGAERTLRDFESRRMHFGTPESWTQRILAIQHALGPEYLNFRLRTPISELNPVRPSFDEYLECIRRFGEEVLPEVRSL